MDLIFTQNSFSTLFCVIWVVRCFVPHYFGVFLHRAHRQSFHLRFCLFLIFAFCKAIDIIRGFGRTYKISSGCNKNWHLIENKKIVYISGIFNARRLTQFRWLCVLARISFRMCITNSFFLIFLMGSVFLSLFVDFVRCSYTLVTLSRLFYSSPPADSPRMQMKLHCSKQNKKHVSILSEKVRTKNRQIKKSTSSFQTKYSLH